MYQTVGQDAIEYVARALDVPLYRRVISGSAVNLSSEYGSRRANLNGALDGDETEDLYGLLADVKVRLYHHAPPASPPIFFCRTRIRRSKESLWEPYYQTTSAFALSMCALHRL